MPIKEREKSRLTVSARQQFIILDWNGMTATNGDARKKRREKKIMMIMLMITKKETLAKVK